MAEDNEEQFVEAIRLTDQWAREFNDNSGTVYPIDRSELLSCRMFCTWLLKHYDLTKKKPPIQIPKAKKKETADNTAAFEALAAQYGAEHGLAVFWSPDYSGTVNIESFGDDDVVIRLVAEVLKVLNELERTRIFAALDKSAGLPPRE